MDHQGPDLLSCQVCVCTFPDMAQCDSTKQYFPYFSKFWVSALCLSVLKTIQDISICITQACPNAAESYLNSSCNITLNKSIFYLPKSYHNLFMRRRAREYGGKKFVHILCLPKTYNNLFMRRRREHGGKKSTKRSRSKWWLYSVWLLFYFWIMGIYCQSLGKCSLIFHFSSVILNCYSIFCVWYVLLYLNIFDHMLWLPWLWVHTWHIHLHVSISPRDLA